MQTQSIIEAAPSAITNLADMSEATPAGVMLASTAVENDLVVLTFRIPPPLPDPRHVLEGELLEKLAEWKDMAQEWKDLAPAVEMLAQTDAESAQCVLEMQRAREAWTHDLEACRDPSDSEKVYAQAKAREAIVTERRSILAKTVEVRRLAAAASWDKRRSQIIQKRTRTAQERVQFAESYLSRATDATAIRQLRDEMSMLILLRLGSNGLTGIVPLA
ncbi:MAG TPA: hypothetical protein VH592_21120 [Gemmataceae bacterium]|jgi:hypothetical protein